MSNDSKEGRHVVDLVRAFFPAESKHKKDVIDKLEFLTSVIYAIGSCLSADKDVLSQWRAYAGNGGGVAIGFDREALEAAATLETDDSYIVSLGPIAYGERHVKEIIMEILAKVSEHYDGGAMSPPLPGLLLFTASEAEQQESRERYRAAHYKLIGLLRPILNLAYRVKSPFFEEEKEWRILSLLTVQDGELGLESAEFEPTAERLKPFRSFPSGGFEKSVVREVVLGPKNNTPDEVIKLFLRKQGFEHVRILRSSGSYR